MATKATTQVRKVRNCIKSGGLSLLNQFLEAKGADLDPVAEAEAGKLKKKWKERKPKGRFK